MSRPSSTDKLLAAACLVGAGGLAYKAYKILQPSESTNGLGLSRGESGKFLTPPGAKPKSTAVHDVYSIDARVAQILKLLKKTTDLTNHKDLAAQINEHATKILSQKCGGRWCVPEKNKVAEVKWLFDAIRKPSSPYAVRYTRDPIYADLFRGADRTLLKTHGGDCDDYTVTLGALLMAVGHEVKVRVIATTDAGTWSHVYLITRTSWDNGGEWMAVDCSVEKPAGWEAPGAKETARTGKPHGIVLKVKDYAVL